VSDLPEYDPLDDGDEPIEPAAVETVDLTDGRKYRRSRDKVKREVQETEEFWRAVLREKAGRREMWRLIAVEGHAFSTDFAYGPVGFPDERATWYAHANQQSALRLYHDLMRIDHEGVRRMHIECDGRFMVAKPERQQRD
jgi:hypothetical protein